MTRVITISRVQVGSEITGVVRERRVEEGDVVAPGDVLVVLRADDLAAQVRAAEAALSQLERSTRPQAEVALREAESRLAQADREAQRRRDLFERALIARLRTVCREVDLNVSSLSSRAFNKPGSTLIQLSTAQGHCQ